MYWFDTFTQSKLRSGIFTAWIAFVLLAEPSATAQIISSVTAPSGSQGSAAAAANDLEARRLLSLDAAAIAARGKLFELSIEAAQRAMEQPVVIATPDFQSSLLGGQPSRSPRVSSSLAAPGESPGQAAVRQKLELLVEVWKQTEAPPEKIAAVLQDIVLPSGPGQMIQTFAPRSGSTMYRSFNFELAAKPVALPRVLGLDAVEWARAAGQLDSLISVLEKRVEQPASQFAASGLLIYAQRLAGRPEAATKILENLSAKPAQTAGEGNLILIALMRPLPEHVDANHSLDESKIADFAARMLLADPNGDEVRGYVLQRLAHAIKQGDRANVTRYTEAIEASIDQLNVTEAQFRAQLKTNLSASAERECIRQGQTDLAIDFALRQNASGQQRVRYVGMEEERLTAFAKGSSQQRMERARRLLLETPLASPEQLDFATLIQINNPPEFFQSRDGFEEVLRHSKPFEASNTVSLLDMLLNEADALKQTEQVVDQLFKNASDREDIIKLMARWMMLRAAKRGQQVDEKISVLGRFASEQDFIDWIKRMPFAAAAELLSQHIADGPLSEPLVELFEHHDPGRVDAFTGVASVEGLAEKYYRRQNPSAPPLRSLTELKHWCVSSIAAGTKSTNYRLILQVPGSAEKQGLGHQAGALMLRYPVTGDLTIQGKFKSSSLEDTSLGLNGISVRVGKVANVWFRQRFPDSQRLSLGDSNTIAWNLTGDTLSLSIDGDIKRKWRQNAAGCPFVLLTNHSINGAVPADLTIMGNIEIPREVALIDRGLTGWGSLVFYHSLPSTGTAFEEIQSGASDNGSLVSQIAEPSKLIWREDNGEITVGKRSADSAAESAKVIPSLSPFAGTVATQTHQTEIHYERPLLEGERIEFELFHNSKAQTAAPALGRVAYCLDGDKVALHWIASDAELKRLNMSEDNRADDPSGQQLAPVQLEDNAWNRLALRIEAGKVVVSIGDQDVYRRPLAESESTLFGFFADSTAPEARIRNVVLKGDWPSELPKDLWELAD